MFLTVSCHRGEGGRSRSTRRNLIPRCSMIRYNSPLRYTKNFSSSLERAKARKITKYCCLRDKLQQTMICLDGRKHEVQVNVVFSSINLISHNTSQIYWYFSEERSLRFTALFYSVDASCITHEKPQVCCIGIWSRQSIATKTQFADKSPRNQKLDQTNVWQNFVGFNATMMVST